jgi:phosphate transport system substrate-binding protein
MGIGVERNPGVTNFVKEVSGAIGYVELTYAVNVGLPTVKLQNKSGYFIKPTLKSVNYAARVSLPADTRALIINTPTPEGYPISAFTWLIFYKEQCYSNRTLKRAKTLSRFLWWLIHEGQQYNIRNVYGVLPNEAIYKAEDIIRSMTFKGKPVVDW